MKAPSSQNGRFLSSFHLHCYESEREGLGVWRRANGRRRGRAVLAIGRQNERRDTVMRARVTPAEVHANNATGPRQVTSNQTPVIVTRQTGNKRANAVGPSVSISPDATDRTAPFANRHTTALACFSTFQSNNTIAAMFSNFTICKTSRGHIKFKKLYCHVSSKTGSNAAQCNSHLMHCVPARFALNVIITDNGNS